VSDKRWREIIERLFLSLVGGILIPFVLMLSTSLVGESFDELGKEWVVDGLMYSFVGPLKIWARVFPPPPSCSSCGPTNAAIIATIVTDFLFYSLLTDLLQIMIEKIQRKKPRQRFIQPSV
jgi:hypothetical protein